MFIERYNQLFNVRPQPGSNNVDLATSFYKYLTSPRSFTTQVDQKYFYSLNQQALIKKNSNDENVIGAQHFNTMLSENADITATILQTVGVKGHDGIALAIVK